MSTYILDKDSGLYGVIRRNGVLVYEAQFTYAEARRLVGCLNRKPDLTWEDCAEYVEGRTKVKP